MSRLGYIYLHCEAQVASPHDVQGAMQPGVLKARVMRVYIYMRHASHFHSNSELESNIDTSSSHRDRDLSTMWRSQFMSQPAETCPDIVDGAASWATMTQSAVGSFGGGQWVVKLAAAASLKLECFQQQHIIKHPDAPAALDLTSAPVSRRVQPCQLALWLA